MSKGFEDFIGKRFGRLVVLKECEREGRNRQFECICDCGNKCKTKKYNLTRGDTKSCGCLRREIAKQKAKNHTTHGYSKTRLYQIWEDMKRRCYNSKRKNYKNYGERGIEVCKEWLEDFSNFKEWAFKNGYKDFLTIDRIDVNGNYEPSNCRWATAIEQANNKRNNRFIEYDGEKYTISGWAFITGLNKSTLQKRLNVRKWNIQKALTTKDGRKI